MEKGNGTVYAIWSHLKKKKSDPYTKKNPEGRGKKWKY